jgi:GNAT superfamily N-acetyltransferase
VSAHPLRAILDDAARGIFPAFDGDVDVLPSPGGVADVMLGFTGHYVLAADVDADEVAAHMISGDLSLPMAPETLVWLAGRLGSRPTTLDVLLVGIGTGEGASEWLREVDGHDHPRVERASRYRRGMRVFVAADDAVLIVGRGVCDRFEFGFEVLPQARGRGLGREIGRAAIALAPEGEPMWAQVAAGNAASLRALLAAGFAPVACEMLFPRA